MPSPPGQVCAEAIPKLRWDCFASLAMTLTADFCKAVGVSTQNIDGRIGSAYTLDQESRAKKCQTLPLASLMEVIGVLIEKYEDEHVPELT